MTTQTLTVGSFNVRCPFDKAPNDWDTRAPRLLKTLEDVKFDIFGVQETVPKQLQTLSENTDYKIIGHGRDEDHGGESSSIVYCPKRLELISEETFWLSETPDIFSKSWGSGLPRIGTIGIFKDKLTGTTFAFANTHLHHERMFETQKNQVAVVLQRLKPYMDKGLPAILTGDFNSEPSNMAATYVSTILDDARLVSKTPPTGPMNETFHAFIFDPQQRNPNSLKERIDYIFTSRKLIDVLAFQTIDNFDENQLASSDHYPIRATIAFA